MEQNPSGIKSFLKKAAENNGTQYDEAKADKLIETYKNNYDSIVGDIGRKVGIPEEGIQEFKKLAFEKYQIQPVQQPADTTDYGMFDKETLDKSPQARQNYERWQKDQANKEIKPQEVSSPTYKGLVSTPEQEFISQDEFESRNWFSPNVGEDLRYQKPYEQPMTDKTDYMGVFNKKEDYKIADESGVETSVFEQVRKSAGEAEYPTEYIIDVSNLKKRIESLPEYFPETAESAEQLKQLLAKSSPQNIEEIRKQIEQIEGKYYSNPKTFGQFQSSRSGSPMWSEYENKVVKDPITTAAKMLAEDSDKLKRTLSGNEVTDKFGAFKGTVEASGNIAKGARIGVEEYVKGYGELLTTLKGNKAVSDILNKVESEEELTTDEKLLLKVIVDNAKLHGSLDKNIPTSYKIGEALGTSLGFMGEFIATGGAVSGVGKSLLKQAAKAGITGTGKKLALNAVIKLAQTGIQTPLMPSLYQKTALDVSKGEDFWKAFGNNIWQTAAETGSERIFLVNPVKAAGGAANEFLRRAGINFSVDKGAVGVLKNMGEEYLEEKVGEIMTAPKDYNSFKLFWKGFTDKEQNLITFGSTALLTGGMGTGGLAVDEITKAKYKARVLKLDRALPADLKAEIDNIVSNTQLSVQEQYSIVADIISQRLDSGEIEENQNEVTANAIQYLNYKTIILASESIDKTTNVENSNEVLNRINELQDNDGNITTVTIGDEKWYVKNSQDLGNPNTSIFLKDAKGKTKAVNSKLITTWTKQTPEEVKTDIANEDAFIEAEKLKHEAEIKKAAEKGVVIGAEIENEFGTGTVTDISKEGVITAQDENGAISTSTIDETAPVVEKKELTPGEVNIDELPTEERFLHLRETDPAAAEHILRTDIEEGKKFATELLKQPGTPTEKLANFKEAQIILKEATDLENKYFPKEEKLAESGKKKGKSEKKSTDIKSDLPVNKQSTEIQPSESLQELQPGVEGGVQKLSTSERVPSSGKTIESVTPELTKEQKEEPELTEDEKEKLSSTDPNEIYSSFIEEQNNAPYNGLNRWQKELIDSKETFSSESFNRHGDRNQVGQTLAKTWLRKTGTPIDTWVNAWNMAAEEGQGEFAGNQITVQDVVDFIISNPSRSARKTTNLQNLLRTRYKELTGISINNHKFVNTVESDTDVISWLESKGINTEFIDWSTIKQIIEERKDELTKEQYEQFSEFADEQVRVIAENEDFFGESEENQPEPVEQPVEEVKEPEPVVEQEQPKGLKDLFAAVETEEQRRLRILEEKLGKLTPTQRKEADKLIQEVDAEIKAIENAVANRQAEIKKKRKELKAEAAKPVKDVLFDVPKDLSPENIERILQPLKDELSLKQREYWDAIKKKEDIIDKAAKIAAAQQELVIPEAPKSEEPYQQPIEKVEPAKDQKVEKYITDTLKYIKKEFEKLLTQSEKIAISGDKEKAHIYMNMAKDYMIDENEFSDHVRKHPEYYMDSNIDPVLRFKNRETNLAESPVKKEADQPKDEDSSVNPKGITVVQEEDNGMTLVYGSKNNVTRLSVKGLSTDEIQEELDFEKDKLKRAQKEIPEFEKELAMRPLDDVYAATKQQLTAAKRIIESTKVTIPFLERKLTESKNQPEADQLPEAGKKVKEPWEMTREEYNSLNNVDENEPVNYHGTSIKNANSILKQGFKSINGSTANITQDFEAAKEYADSNESDNDEPSTVIKVRLKIGAKPISETGIDSDSFNPKDVVVDHSELVKKAISEGKEILPEVKKDYPELFEGEKKASQPEVKAPEKGEEQQVEKIEDFGEKISGAKKMVYQRLAEITQNDIIKDPLSKTFPRPDFVQLVKDGTLSEEAAFLLKFVYESIPAKPRQTYKVKNWADTVQNAIDLYSQLLQDKNTADKLIDKVTNSAFLKQKYGSFLAVQRALGFPAEDINTGAYDIKVFISVGGKKTYSVVKGHHIISDHTSVEEAATALKNILSQNKEKSKETKFGVYQDYDTKKYFIGKETATGVLKLIKGYDTATDAFRVLNTQREQLEQLWEGMKIRPQERRKVNRKRVGTDYRKGKNVTPNQFSETFGFRGTQFGNWVKNDERQESLNEAYDALMDLATALNVSPRALSLGGELGMAFGARGSGDASAHYEPGHVVINLTKTKGAGSLAHEWWHALDSYFSRKRGVGDGFLTQKPRQGVIVKNDNGKREVVPDERVRLEMHEAFKAVVEAINKSGMPKRGLELDKTRSKLYWSDIIEMSARSFENFIIEKLGATNEQNDYLANFKETEEWIKAGLDTNNYPYPLAEESPAINEKFQQLFDTIQEKEEDGNTVMFRMSNEEKDNSENIDKQYFDAIERGDMEAAQRIVDQQAANNGYISKEDYKMSHRAPSLDTTPSEEKVEQGGDFSLTEVANGFSTQPADYFDVKNGARWYGYNDTEGQQSASAIRSAFRAIQNGKSPTITIYRAVPKNLKEGSVRNGDWITFSEEYAKGHGKHVLGFGNYKIIKEEVSANDVWWDGNDINEWGYDNGQKYAYKDTKNNKKLTDVITKDEAGNIIPPSKRFNKNNPDPNFRIIGETGAANLDKAEEATTRLDNLKVAREMEQVGNIVYAEPIYIEDEGWAIKTNPHKYDTLGGISVNLYPTKELAQQKADIKNKLISEKIGKKDAKQIKLATGWERGADGKWRYEVPDGNFTPTVQRMIDSQRRNDIPENWGLNYPLSLSKIINDEQLYKAYPELADVKVQISVKSGNKNKGSYSSNLLDTELGKIDVQASDFENFRSVLLHEIQHAIQEIEGFARGGNVNSMGLNLAEKVKDIINKNTEYKSINDRIEDEKNELSFNGFDYESVEYQDKLRTQAALWKKVASENGLPNEPVEYYKRLAGEVESRNVQTRMNYTPEQRRQSLLEETEDVSRKDQIFIYDSLGASMEAEPEIKVDAKIDISDKANPNIKDRKNTINALNTLVKQFGVPITVIHSSELSDVVGMAAKRKKGTPVAFYHNGVAYIIADKIESVSHTKESYLHEAIWHLGLDLLFNAGPVTVLGKKYNTKNDLLDEVFNRLDQQLIDEIAAQYTGGDTSTPQNRREVANEVLAKLNELERTPGRLEIFMDSLWKFIKKLVGFSSKQFTRTDLHRMLADHRKLVKKAARGGISESSDAKLNGTLDFFARLGSSLIPETIKVNGVERPTRNSNGQFIHPTLEGIKNFWEWFGNSTTVNEKGQPIVFYHGTGADIEAFDKRKAHDKEGRAARVGWGKDKFYFTTQADIASNWAERSTDRGAWSGKAVTGDKYGSGMNPNVIPVYLKVENPIDGDMYFNMVEREANPKKELYYYGIPQNIRDRAIAAIDKYLKKEKYDGITERGYITAVFNPTQIKSATGNTGNFSESDPNINFRFISSNPETNKIIDRLKERQRIEAEQKAANPTVTPPKPPITPKPPVNEPESKETGGRVVDKTIVKTRTYEGDFGEAIDRELEKIGLTRTTQKQKEAEQIGLKVIEMEGLEGAMARVRSGEIGGAPAGAIWHEKLKDIRSKQMAETNPEMYDILAKEYVDITEEMGNAATIAGQFSAFFNYIYQTSDLGFNAEKLIRDYKAVNNGEITPELEEKFKKLAEEYKDTQEKLAEAYKKVQELEEQAAVDAIKASVERKNKRKAKASEKIREKTDKLVALIDLGKLNRPGMFMAASPGSIVWDLAMTTAKTTVLATGRTIEAIAKGWEVIYKSKWYNELDSNKKKQARNEYYDYFTAAQDKDETETKEKPTYSYTKNGLKISHSVIRDLVEQGYHNIEDLTQAVYDAIVDDLQGITVREVRDAITGYGQTQEMNQEDIEREIRKMKDLGRVVSGIEDVDEGQRPQRSGLQRDKPDPDIRAAHKELREAMKVLPVDEQLRLDQQKTQLDANKTRLRNQIEDLQREIDKGEQTPRNVRTKQEDDELKQLIIARDAKKKEHDEIFKNEEYLNKKRVELTKKAIDRRIAELERRINEGDFAPKVRKEVIADNELIRLRAKKLRIEEDYKKEMYKAKLRNRTQSEKVKDGLWDAWNVTRALRATGEFSFVGIQGLINTIAHPIQAKQAFKTAMRFFASRKAMEDWMNNLESQDYYPMLKESKLAITKQNAELTAREELFYSGWTDAVWNSAGKLLGRNPDTWMDINPLRMVERAAVGYLDTQRLLRFMDGVDMLKEKKLPYNKDNKQAYVEMADVINTFTGRGSIGRLDPELLTKIFFSPRNWSSVIKTATPYAFIHFGKKRAGTKGWEPSVAQKMALYDFSKFVGLTTVLVGIAALALNGDDDDENKVELDPRSTDFGKIKIGDIRIDPWGGRIQQIVMISRLINGNVKNSYGEIIPTGTPYKSPTKAELMIQMASNKFAPSMSMLYKHLSTQIDADGNKVDQWGEEYSFGASLKENLYPIYWGTLAELAQDDITALDGLLAFYSFFGGGVNIYDQTPEKKTNRTLKEQTLKKAEFDTKLETGYKLTPEEDIQYQKAWVSSRLKQQYVVLKSRATKFEKEGNEEAAERIRQLIEESKIMLNEAEYDYQTMLNEKNRLAIIIKPE